MNKKVVVIGAGGHGRVIADIIKQNHDILIGFLDDCPTASNLNILGKICECEKYKQYCFIIAIGNNDIRKKISDSYPGLRYYTAIHPTAVLGDNTLVEAGSCVMANAVINDSAYVGRHCIINTHAVVEHDDRVDAFVHISPGAVLCGNVKVGCGTHIGAGAVVINNITVAGDCIIGAGATVTKNILDSGVYVGTPAAKIRETKK